MREKKKVLPLESTGEKKFQLLFQQYKYIHDVLLWAKIHWSGFSTFGQNKIEMIRNKNWLFGRHFEKVQNFILFYLFIFFFSELWFFIVRTYMCKFHCKIPLGKWFSTVGSLRTPLGHQGKWKYLGHKSVRELQMIFQTSDTSICNGNIKPYRYINVLHYILCSSSFMFPLLLLAMKIQKYSCNSSINIFKVSWWNLNKIGWSELHKI